MDSYCSPQNQKPCRCKESQSGNQASKKRKQEVVENEKRVVKVKVEAAKKGKVDADDQKQKHESELGSPPPDSWSWRKYGQKPIKGSPYTRGYYRCSTGKGCSAKKQVERCKEDASIFIITYTSPHNHNHNQHHISSAGLIPNSSTQKHRPQSPEKRTHGSSNKHTRVQNSPSQGHDFLYLISSNDDSQPMPMGIQESQEPEPYVVSLDSVTSLPLPHHDHHHPFASYNITNHPTSRKLEDQNYDFFDELELDL